MIIKRAKSAIVAGAGRFGCEMAGRLARLGYNVTVIDKNEEAFDRIPEGFGGYQIAGNATDAELLERVGVKSCNMLIACTNSDSVNLLIAQIAAKIFSVKEIYMRLNEIEKQSLIADLNIKIISPYTLAVHEFERLAGISPDEG